MNFYQQPYGVPYPQGMYQQPVYPQFIYADQLVNPNDSGSLGQSQQSYIENILRLNYGKVATVYMNFENSQWGSKVFKGIVQAAGAYLVKNSTNSTAPSTNLYWVLKYS